MTDLFDEALLRRAWNLARSLVRNADDAEDVVQEACIVAYKKAHAIPAHEQWPWFTGVIRNTARNHLRKARARAMSEITLDPQAPERPERLDADQAEQLISALQELSVDEREAVALCHMSGLTREQASQALQININTLKARVRRGIEHLRANLRITEPGIEAYLACVLIPPPEGGFAAAIQRWKGAAKGASSFLAKALVGSSVVILAGIALWLTDPFHATAPKLDASRSEIVATNPGGSENPLGDRVISNPGAPVGPPPDVSDTTGSTQPVQPTLPAAKKVRETVIPENAAPGMLRTRTVFYGDNTIEAQWTELVVSSSRATRHGTFTNFFPNGVARESGQYVNDKRQGEWTYRHKNGELANRGSYLDNLEEGLWESFDDQARRLESGAYKHGQRHGEWKTYYPDGTVKQLAQFKADQLDGKNVCFDKVGNLTRETHWKNGKKHGPETIYSPTGKEVHEYDHGTLIR